MWHALKNETFEIREQVLLNMEQALLERHPSLKANGPLFSRSEKDLDRIGFFYQEGILKRSEGDVVESGLCVLFGFILESQYEMEWVCDCKDQKNIAFGMQLKNSNYVIPLTPHYLRKFPVSDVLDGELPSLDEYMLDICDLVRSGENALKDAMPEGNG